jgi:YscO-like protein
MAQKPKYRLGVLFDIREKAKKAAEDDYAAAQKRVVEEQKKLDGMRQHLREMEQARELRRREYADRMRTGELSINQIQGNDRHLDRMKAEEQAYLVDISRQQEVLVETQALAETKKEAMIKATQDFKALEKHREKWDKKVRYDMMQQEEAAAEDIAQAQYFAKLQGERES